MYCTLFKCTMYGVGVLRMVLDTVYGVGVMCIVLLYSVWCWCTVHSVGELCRVFV